MCWLIRKSSSLHRQIKSNRIKRSCRAGPSKYFIEQAVRREETRKVRKKPEKKVTSRRRGKDIREGRTKVRKRRKRNGKPDQPEKKKKQEAVKKEEEKEEVMRVRLFVVGKG